MSKILIVIVSQFFILSYSCFAQINTWKYEKDTDIDMLVSDIIEFNNSIYFTGYTKKLNSFHYKGFIYKLNSLGIEQDCTVYFKINKSISIISVIPSIDSGMTLLADEFDTSGFYNQSGFRLMKIDTNLSIKHLRSYSFPNNYKTFRTLFRKGNDSSILVFGSFITETNLYRMFIYKLNSSFDSINSKYYLNDVIMPVDLKNLPNNSYWIMRDHMSDYALVDSSLNLISDSEGSAPEYFVTNCGVKWDSDSSFYFIGDILNNDQDMGFFHQFHTFDTTGLIINSWGSIDTTDTPAFWGAADYSNKDSIFLGGIKNINLTNPFYSSTPSWYVLLQTDSMLNIRWEHFYGGDACYNMTKLIATSDGGCIMAGTRFDYIDHPWVHERDLYILKVNAEGLITSTNEQPASIVHDAIVYPNPGSNVLRVQVAAQHPESFFKLYNMSGKLVLQSPIHGKTAAFNTTFLPPATYVYTITAKTGLNEKGKWVKE